MTVEAAFNMLVHASTTTNGKLHVIAAELVLTGELSGPVVRSPGRPLTGSPQPPT